MDSEMAHDFLRAAQKDYDLAVQRYVGLVRQDQDGVNWYTEERRAVLAAQQVLELAQQECRAAQQDQRCAEEYAGVCERCTRVGPRWVVGAAALCADCAAAAR